MPASPECCAWCGMPGSATAEWSFERHAGRVAHGCPACVRAHLSEIEAG
ncbi:MAG: hypothetical protein ACR2KE_04375 [Candidatus Nanopelagicales bacterium]